MSFDLKIECDGNEYDATIDDDGDLLIFEYDASEDETLAEMGYEPTECMMLSTGWKDFRALLEKDGQWEDFMDGVTGAETTFELDGEEFTERYDMEFDEFLDYLTTFLKKSLEDFDSRSRSIARIIGALSDSYGISIVLHSVHVEDPSRILEDVSLQHIPEIFENELVINDKSIAKWKRGSALITNDVIDLYYTEHDMGEYDDDYRPPGMWPDFWTMDNKNDMDHVLASFGLEDQVPPLPERPWVPEKDPDGPYGVEFVDYYWDQHAQGGREINTTVWYPDLESAKRHFEIVTDIGTANQQTEGFRVIDREGEIVAWHL
jgi:hypothetical protein